MPEPKPPQQTPVALVTGGAHRIGRAIVLALAEHGMDVVVHYGGSDEKAARTADEVRERGRRAWTLQADLASPEEIDRLFEEVGDRCGRLDVLVNSAASFEKQPFSEVSSDDFDRVIAVNLRAPLLCAQRAAALIRRSPRDEGATGSILNISDLSGLLVWPGYVQHGVAKAGLLHLTKIAARELGPEIRVNAVVPGRILPHPGQDPESKEWREAGDPLPLGRTGATGNIGETVVFLVANDFITGQVIPVDGGELLLAGGR